jgi:serine phosphatase RsbU (regulator of sigma subunit)
MTTPRRSESGPQRQSRTGQIQRRETGVPSVNASTRHGQGLGNPATESSMRHRTQDSGTSPATESQGASSRRGHHPPPPVPGQGMGLRLKFTFILAGITAVAMVALGMIMAHKADKYLFSQKQHDGIELAKMASVVAATVADQLNLLRNLDADSYSAPKIREQYVNLLSIYYKTASEWNIPGIQATDILAVKLNCPDKWQELSNHGFGDDEDRNTEVTERLRTLFIPKLGSEIRMPPQQVDILAGIRKTAEGDIPIYRFKVRLEANRFGGRDPDGDDWKMTPHLRLDINASSVDHARSNLWIAIAIGVLLSIAVVIGVAHYLAITITRPLDLLIEDMQTVAKGELDHQTVPHSTDEIGVLATEFNRMTVNLKAAQSALVEQEKAEYELSIAREVQRQLLPANSPEILGYQCASFYQGAKAVSGDYFDFIDLGNGRWGFIIADVSGKGIPGSMVMAVTRTIIRLISFKHQANTADTLKETNRLIAKQIKRGMFVTSFYAVLDTASGVLTYSSAGHNPMVIYRAASRTRELANGKGIALGFNDGPIFDRTIEQNQTTLNHGDAIVLYTDGFPEAMSEENEEFGDDRFYDLVAAHGSEGVEPLIKGLVGEIAKHRGTAEQSDDLTMIAVRRA